MVRNQSKSDIGNTGRKSSARGTRPQGIEKPLPAIRKSARLTETKRSRGRAVSEGIKAPKRPFPSPSTSDSPCKEIPSNSPVLSKPNPVNRPCFLNGHETDRKRKRSQEAESPRVQDQPIEKRARTSLEGSVDGNKETTSDTDNKKGGPIRHWIREGGWPKEYFEQEINMDTPLARKKSLTSLRRQVLEPGGVTPSQESDDKSAPYKDPGYAAILAERGSFLSEFRQGITDDSKIKCQTLLDAEQAVPRYSDTLFRDDLFKDACEKLQDRNEARVVSDIARLIVPSAETLATHGATHLEHLIVGLNERWNESIPITSTATKLPQPDFSVGFKRAAFTQEQLKKLEPFTGNVFSATKLSSFFLATWRMYFPFFTCEVKCGAGGLDVADRQNANSMTLAVRGIVELFKFVKREKELHQKILAFSVSHDDKGVRIFGHYPVIDGTKVTFYRHNINTFDFTALDGKEKWTAYKFTKNVYEKFMPDHHKLICSAIDDIPAKLDFGVPLADSSASHASTDIESELADSQDMARSAPISQDTGSYKKPRLTVNGMLKQELDRQRQEHNRQIEQMNSQLNKLISQMQGSSNATPGNESMLQQEVDRLRQEREQSKQEVDGLKEQSKQEVDGLKEQNKELMDRLKEFMDVLKQQSTANA